METAGFSRLIPIRILTYVSRKGYTEDFEEKIIDIYYDKLRYAVQNAEKLVNEMFREEFYDFYGVDKNAVSSPEQMKTELVFDSFTMDIDDMSIAVYFSNKSFMFGHFIDAPGMLTGTSGVTG